MLFFLLGYTTIPIGLLGFLFLCYDTSMHLPFFQNSH